MMKLIIHFVVLALTIFASIDGRKYMKCGPVDGRCLKVDKRGICPVIPYCPTGLKRKLTDRGCCCVLKDSFKVKKVIPSLVHVEKAKIVSKTLASIASSFDKIKNIRHHNSIHSRNIFRASIDGLSRRISDAMKDGINNLAMLIDVEFETILKLVFDDERTHESRKINLVIQEANEIYEKGNRVMEEISMLVKGMKK